MHSDDSTRRTRAWLCGLLLAGFALRAWAIGFRLPYVFHPDEPHNLRVLLRIFQSSNFDPEFFRYPSLSFYVSALGFELYYWFGRLTHQLQSRSDLVGPVLISNGTGFTSMPQLFVLARAVSLACSMVTALAVFATARQLGKRPELGLLAAALVLIAPTAVESSRYVTPDAMATCWVALASYCAARILVQGRSSDHLLAAIAAGLAASTKYNAGLVLVTVATAILLRHGRQSFRVPWLYAGPLVALLVFAATTPYAWLTAKPFWHDLTLEARHYATGHPGMEGNTWSWYARWLWLEQGGALAFTLLALGLMVRHRQRELLLISVFPLIYLAFIGRLEVHNERTALPLVPGLSILAAWGLYESMGWLFSRWSWPGRPAKLALTGLICVAVLADPTWRSFKRTRKLLGPDGRDSASAWIRHNVAKNSRIALESYGPWIDPHRYRIREVELHGRQKPSWYRRRHFDYLVFGQDEFRRFFAEPKRYARHVAGYNRLFKAFESVASFKDGGYEVRIYRVTPEPERPRRRSHRKPKRAG